MAFRIRDSFEEREVPDEGTTFGICIWVIDLGTQINRMFGSRSRKVLITWELPDNIMKSGEPFVVSKQYTASLGGQANLRKDLKTWRGKDFTPEEAKAGFDPKRLLKVPAMLTISHNETETKKYVNVIGVAKVPAQMKAHIAEYKLANATKFFDLEEPDWNVFETLPEWIRKIIQESPEYKKLKSPQELDPDINEDIDDEWEMVYEIEEPPPDLKD